VDVGPVPGTVRFLRMAMGLVGGAVSGLNHRHSQRMVQQASGFIWGETVPRKRQPTAARSEWSSLAGRRRRETYDKQQSVVGMDEIVLSRQPRWSQSAAQELVVGDGDPVGDYFHVWLSRSPSYCSNLLGQGFEEFSPVTVIVLTTG